MLSLTTWRALVVESLEHWTAESRRGGALLLRLLRLLRLLFRLLVLWHRLPEAGGRHSPTAPAPDALPTRACDPRPAAEDGVEVSESHHAPDHTTASHSHPHPLLLLLLVLLLLLLLLLHHLLHHARHHARTPGSSSSHWPTATAAAATTARERAHNVHAQRSLLTSHPRW